MVSNLTLYAYFYGIIFCLVLLISLTMILPFWYWLITVASALIAWYYLFKLLGRIADAPYPPSLKLTCLHRYVQGRCALCGAICPLCRGSMFIDFPAGHYSARLRTPCECTNHQTSDNVPAH